MTERGRMAKPLFEGQIRAAAAFWNENGGLEIKQIGQLRRAFPDHRDGVTVKAIAVNAIYGTNIFAILKVGDCLDRFLSRKHAAGPDLVEEMVVEISHITNRQNYSFSAKYAHCFIDPNLPVLDSYAEWMVAEHLGQVKSRNPKRYLRFVEDVETLKNLAGLACTSAELDAYLWVAGEYWSWRARPNLKISGDFRVNFERLAQDSGNELALAKLLGVSQSPHSKMA